MKKQNQEQNQEQNGTVKSLFFSKGFGFISQNNDVDIFFNTKNLPCNVEPGDKVAFLKKTRKDRTFALAIRKVYQNEYGIAFVERINNTHTHINLDAFLPHIIANIKDTSKCFAEIQHDFGYCVGEAECVMTEEGDDIIYAIRKGRKGYSRLVKNKHPEKTSYVTLVIKKSDEKTYVIITAFYGKKTALELFDTRASDYDKRYWQTHALIYKEEDVKLKTITTTNPYISNIEIINKNKNHEKSN